MVIRDHIVVIVGWLDNSNSFQYLGDSITKHIDCHCIGIDLMGHGLSSHVSKDGVYNIQRHVATVKQFHGEIFEEDQSKVEIIGHSMG